MFQVQCRGLQSLLNLLNKMQCLPLSHTGLLFQLTAVAAALTPSLLYSSFRVLERWLDFLFIFFYLSSDWKGFISLIRQGVKGSLLWVPILCFLWNVSLLSVGKTRLGFDAFKYACPTTQ